jgi:hypothetical protein
MKKKKKIAQTWIWTADLSLLSPLPYPLRHEVSDVNVAKNYKISHSVSLSCVRGESALPHAN